MRRENKKTLITIISSLTVICCLLVAVFGNSIKVSAYAEAKDLPSLTENKKVDFIAVAKSQIGYTEDTDGSTIYGKWFNDKVKSGTVDFTTQPWCAMFLSWCAEKAKIGEDIFKCVALCDDSVKDFKSQNRWHDAKGYTPQVGDIIYFKYGSNLSKTTDHIGIVYQVNSERVFTYEGNKTSAENGVGEGSYLLTNSSIVGYATPNYDGNTPTASPAPTATPNPTPTTTPTTSPTVEPTTAPTVAPTEAPKSVKYNQPTKVLRVGAKGDDVKWVQYVLNKYGKYNLDTDGKFGNGTRNALKKAQAKLKISADGVVGNGTINALKKAIGVSSAYIVVDTKSNSVVTFAKVTNLKAARYKYNQIKLTWTKIKDAKAYVVLRYNTKTKKYENYKTVNTNSFIDKSLTVNQTYKYKVRAYKSVYGINCYGAFSSVVSCSAKPVTVKAKLATYAKRAIKLYWTRQSDVDGYQVYRKDAKNGKYKLRKTITTNKTIQFINTGLTKGRTYYYRVRSYKVVKGKKVYGDFSNICYKKIK